MVGIPTNGWYTDLAGSPAYGYSYLGHKRNNLLSYLSEHKFWVDNPVERCAGGDRLIDSRGHGTILGGKSKVSVVN